MRLLNFLRRRQLSNDEEAALSLTPVLITVGIIIGAVVGLAVLAALAPTYLSSVGDVAGTFNDPNTTVGDDTADGLLPIFGLMVSFAGLFAIVGIIIVAVRLRNG